MKIAIDMDGTFWEHWTFFGEMGRGLQALGHQVGILTGHDVAIEAEDRRLLLARCNFTPDFFLNRDDEALKRYVIEWKAEILDKEGIDVHYDDDAAAIAKHLKNGTFLIKTRSSTEADKF